MESVTLRQTPRDGQITMTLNQQQVGQYLSLQELCTCTQTYAKYADQINPFPQNLTETLPALEALCQHIVDPIIHEFGRDRFHLSYGFCSADLKRWIAQKDPATGIKNGKSSPQLDQHMAHELNRNGQYYCSRLGAACDFRILGLPSTALVTWIVEQGLPFDSLYFYGAERPIHISYGPQQKRAIWAFTATGVPTRRVTEIWQSSRSAKRLAGGPF